MALAIELGVYSPNTLNKGTPRQATQAKGRGFFTAPQRAVEGKLQRTLAESLRKDYWSQPRLFFNSLVPQEQQFLINAMRFEASQLKSDVVKKNVVAQLNKIHNKIAVQVAEAVGVPAPAPDAAFYHDTKTAGVSTFGEPLKKLAGLKIGVLSSTEALDQDIAGSLKVAFEKDGVSVVIVAESLSKGVDQTYSATDAINFDAVVVGSGAGALVQSTATGKSTLYPAGRPAQILLDAYRYGKPVALLGESVGAMQTVGIPPGPGVYGVQGQGAGSGTGSSGAQPGNSTTSFSRRQADSLAANLREGLSTFRFLNRFPVEK